MNILYCYLKKKYLEKTIKGRKEEKRKIRRVFVLYNVFEWARCEEILYLLRVNC